MIDLDELERLAKAATPGPWRAGVLWSDGAYPVGPYTRNEAVAKADAAFIAAAREAAPALVAEVRRLREELASSERISQARYVVQSKQQAAIHAVLSERDALSARVRELEGATLPGSCEKCGLLIDWSVDGEIQPVCYACGPGAKDFRQSWKSRAEAAERELVECRAERDRAIEESNKYFVKARVYGAIACEYGKALGAFADRGEALARAALEWRHSSDGNGVPIVAVEAIGALLNIERDRDALAERVRVMEGAVALLREIEFGDRGRCHWCAGSPSMGHLLGPDERCEWRALMIALAPATTEPEREGNG